jgi:hypothetical protein
MEPSTTNFHNIGTYSIKPVARANGTDTYALTEISFDAWELETTDGERKTPVDIRVRSNEGRTADEAIAAHIVAALDAVSEISTLELETCGLETVRKVAARDQRYFIINRLQGREDVTPELLGAIQNAPYPGKCDVSLVQQRYNIACHAMDSLPESEKIAIAERVAERLRDSVLQGHIPQFDSIGVGVLMTDDDTIRLYAVLTDKSRSELGQVEVTDFLFHEDMFLGIAQF